MIKVDDVKTAEYTDQNGIFPRGHIALQQHGAQTVVEFRKIEIKELAPGAARSRAADSTGYPRASQG